MSEIDVTKCGAYDEGKCYADECGTTHAYCEDNKNCHYKQIELLKIENKKLKQKLEKIKRLCINKEEARLLYGYKDFDSYDIIRIIESEKQ